MKWMMMFFVCASAMSQNFLRDSLPLANRSANKAFEDGKYEDALKEYLDLYGQDTTNGAVAYNIANTYLALGDQEKAKQFYERALKSDDSEAKKRSKFNLGYLNLQGQNPAEAVQQYIDFLKENPHELDAKRNLELALRQLEQQQQQQNESSDESQDNKDGQQSEDSQSGGGQQDQQDQEQESGDQGEQDSSDQEPSEGQDSESESQNEEEGDNQGEQQGAQPDQPESNPESSQSSDPQESKDPYNEEMKEQILQALQDQEIQQQKEFQKRKIGTTKRRAKDW